MAQRCFVTFVGIRPLARKALSHERRRLEAAEEFRCQETKALNDAVAFEFLPGSRGLGTWSRLGSWMQKFFKFAKNICRKAGNYKTSEQCLASTVMCRHFIAHVAKEDKGVTRPRSARAALSKQRLRRGWASLNGCPSISAIVDAAEAAQPRTKKQSAGLTATMVRCVRRRWGVSASWWERQVSTIMVLGFVSIMRLGEICSLRLAGVRATFLDGSERDLVRLKPLPSPGKLRGLLVHLPWRKNHRAQDCWVPVACADAIALMLRQVQTLRSARSKNEFLFPSRVRVAGGKYAIHKGNPVSPQSWTKSMRRSLVLCVPLMSPRWASLYTGHALRVGGSNQMRKLGISDDVHRRLGGWMQLVSAQGYMALSAREQYAYTLRLAQEKRRRSGMSALEARAALAPLSSVSQL